MAIKIKPRRSETPGLTPSFPGVAADYGELAINIADRKLFVADSSGVATVVGTAGKTMSTTAPSSPVDGQEWFNTEDRKSVV